MPPKCRFGDNANAFLGGLRMWEKEIGSDQVDRSRKLVDRIRLSVAASRSRAWLRQSRRASTSAMRASSGQKAQHSDGSTHDSGGAAQRNEKSSMR